VTRDLTERKESEDKLLDYARQLEAQNKELQQFAYAAAHDMKEPLRKIQLYSSVILEDTGGVLPYEQQRTYLVRSSEAAKRMQTVIDDLLQYSRIAGHTEKFEAVSLNELIQEVYDSNKEAIDQLGAVVEVDELPVINGIAFQIRQLFQNLFSNSLKYRDESRAPHIWITASMVEIPEETDAYGSCWFYMVNFRDNGIGFDMAHAERVFNMFERLHGRDKYPGTGIGLAICRRIMQNNRGFIRAKGSIGVGAVISCFFRMDQPEH
jgi:light-regulated signal transduction histidine kinase (bacteriophytochrome)